MIKNDATAVKVVEPILFDIYGRDHIIDERPYEVQMIGNYYIIDGTLTSESDGGTFHIVIDKRNSRIVKLTHGK
ncbi:YbbC/YhhH family protein [Pedobacter sp. MC2016-14]|uniref:NTF2 fold immunity protein n=1 Tax=Pedobacter sp. MC2016-14 TaxID=2897327 RepID=UPI001E2C1BE5|nr:NTF2 fold immunity protein [Pedobacter sp. MC2016-14]MCD0490121.1 YbbC/YhhH family protein [Pedobacter sp. MC2016-14]